MSRSDDSNQANDDAPLFDDQGEIPFPRDIPLSLGNVARILRVSRWRLWGYERLGLVKRRNHFGQGRVYGWDDCARLMFVLKARKAGVTAFDLAPLIKAADHGAHPRTIRRARTKCLALLEQLNRQQQTLRVAIAEIRFFCKLLSETFPEPPARTRGHDDTSDVP